MESICVAVLAWRSARRGAKVDAGTSAKRRNDAAARARALCALFERMRAAERRPWATRMGRALFARGFVERLAPSG